jgi:hypothetical protein
MNRRHKHGKRKRSCTSLDRANAHVSADPLWMLWPTHSSGVPNPANDYRVAGELSAHPACLPVSQSSVRVVSSALSARRGRNMGLTPWGVRSGCDCPGWFLKNFVKQRQKSLPDVTFFVETERTVISTSMMVGTDVVKQPDIHLNPLFFC